MMKKIRFPLLASAIATALLSTAAQASAPAAVVPSASQPAAPARQLSEAQKIQALIASVEHLQGAVFIRNGTEHEAAEAAAHLRRKLDYAGKRVRTAEQFIDKLATGSSMTGKPYRIRFKDGHSVESAVYFREQLRKLETAPPRTASKG
jgi:hypothetical protein